MRLLLLISAAFCASSSMADCPNYSGTYIGSYRPGDFRSTQTLIIDQEGCDKYTLTSTIHFPDGDPFGPLSVTRTIETQPLVGSEFWEGNILVGISVGTNTEGCRERNEWQLIGSGDIHERWRFECPTYNSRWYGNNHVGSKYVRQN
jgi:hypothetical protein